jgi:3-oxoacyl-[acyl-carrier protein] reductase
MTESNRDADLNLSLSAHVAIVTGANHGIGAATALALARRGVSVLVTYFRVEDAPDPGSPVAYRSNRAKDATEVLESIKAAGGTGYAVEADLSDAATPARLFDLAQREMGAVDILVNNATGWLADTFKAQARDRFGRSLTPVSAETFDRQFGIDARGGAMMIAEFARRHLERGASWGRIISLTSGEGRGFPEEVSYGAAKAALTGYTLAAAAELYDAGITANVVYPPVTDTGWVTQEVRDAVAASNELMHVAQPGDVADVIAYLCEDRAWLINRNVLVLR